MNVVIIGSGDALKQHLDVWVANKRAEVIGILPVSDKDKKHIPDSLKSLTISRIGEVTSKKADVIDICLPVEERPGWVKQAASLSVSIICPLPFGKTPDAESEVIKTCRDKGVSLYPASAVQFTPVFQGAHAEVQNGAVGTPGVIHISAKEAHPGGDNDMFTVFGTQLFAWVVTTFGDVVRVTGKHTYAMSTSGTPVEYAVTTLRMADGAIVHVELVWSGKNIASSFEIAGNEGMLHYDSRESNPVHVETFAGHTHASETDMVLNKSVLARQMEHYTSCLTSGASPLLTVEDAMRAMDVAKAATVSAKTRDPVEIEGGVGQ